MSIEVSVLVPIYNVSKYIERCAHSLFNQTFNEIEFIFVNDASTDNSLELLRNVIAEYPHLTNCIKIIQHKNNMGLAEVRNTALNASQGKYIAVVDSDDYIEHLMIEQLYKKAIVENADIVVSDIYMEYQNKSIYQIDFLSVSPENHLLDILKNKDSHSHLCNKLILKSLYLREDCRVPSGLNYFEDRHVMTRLFFYAKKIVKIDMAFYHYVQYNDNSITKNITDMNFQNMVDFWEMLEDFFKSKNVYKKYAEILEYSKIQNKVNLMLGTKSKSLMKNYADIYKAEELKHIKKFRLGARLIMFNIRNHNFYLALILKNLLLLKNNFRIQNLNIL